MELKKYLDDNRIYVEEALDRLLLSGSTEPSVIHEAMRYSVFAGKKVAAHFMLG